MVPSYGSPRTPRSQTGSHPQNDLQIKRCIAQLDKKEHITAMNMDFIMKKYLKDIPWGQRILCPADFNLSHPNFNISHASNNFIAPVHHFKNKNHWSVVYVSLDTESSEHRGRPVVKAQHYDSTPDKGRHQDVEIKLKTWVKDHHGEDAELICSQAEGPEDNNPNMSGIHALMGAREFGFCRMIRSRTAMWEEEPVKRLKDVLQGLLRSPSRQPADTTQAAPTPPPTAPNSSRRKSRGSNAFVPPLYEDPGIFGSLSPERDQEQTLPPGSSTPVPFRINKSPAVESQDNLAFDINSEFEAKDQERRYPVEAISQQRQKVVAQLDEKRNAAKREKEEWGKCVEEYEKRAKTLAADELTYKTIHEKIEADKKAGDYILANFPDIPPMHSVSDDSEIINDVTALLEKKLSPLKDNLDKQATKKRQSTELLESAGEVCAKRQKQYDEAQEKEKTLAKEVREWSMREKIAALEESHRRERQALREKYETEMKLD
ncbi:hypothetical protein F53441_3681 [Fusarium austroafricanum]|uniref:Uncharacterized protein n=1 Tax=Fusarium austroafricanum TaxID=2364996 RepID=A0A8H4KNW2_9HYPO|nr:hypothetical protein F53441_3681 [Fusarium austroafricanum]